MMLLLRALITLGTWGAVSTTLLLALHLSALPHQPWSVRFATWTWTALMILIELWIERRLIAALDTSAP